MKSKDVIINPFMMTGPQLRQLASQAVVALSRVQGTNSNRLHLFTLSVDALTIATQEGWLTEAEFEEYFNRLVDTLRKKLLLHAEGDG